ncbi:MAG: LysM peptidoglycan-binding domain-containing protein [Candidatus Electrothrix sp. AW1]|nr:LysM peptidoglycan-binding domain-containing protein [Candidatus Electrothrix sp. AX1]MCI5183298.1 LysM peptidoglycan-binding domain-containing protein [Candidatus Electrothrix gigas]
MASSENNPRRIAVVVNSLTGEELKAGKRDASRIYTLFTDHKLGACSNESPAPLHDCKSRNDFWDFIEPIIENWQIRDQFIFYFSGHGMVRNGKYCLQIGTSSQVLPFDGLMSDLDARGVQRAIIILDTCHSGAAIEGNKNPDIFSTINNERIPKGIAVIASSRASQTSHEMRDGSASVFTDLLCTGIETGLEQQCTHNGLISIGDILGYITKKLETDKRYSSFLQRPVCNINNFEQSIWIAKNKSGKFSENETSIGQQDIRTPDEQKSHYEKIVHILPCSECPSIEKITKSLSKIEKYIEYSSEDRGRPQSIPSEQKPMLPPGFLQKMKWSALLVFFILFAISPFLLLNNSVSISSLRDATWWHDFIFDYSIYTVEKGDTLTGIAKKYPGVSYSHIISANKKLLGKNPGHIEKEWEIKIPDKYSWSKKIFFTLYITVISLFIFLIFLYAAKSVINIGKTIIIDSTYLVRNNVSYFILASIFIFLLVWRII